MLASVSLAYSQCGTIYVTSHDALVGGVYPSPTTNLVDAKQNHPYSAVVQVYCGIYQYGKANPNTGSYFVVEADSFILESVAGLPVGFTYTVSSPKLAYNQVGCFIITSNNVTAPIGGSLITFKIKRYGHAYPPNAGLTYYNDELIINDPNTHSVVDLYRIYVVAGSVGINETNLFTNTKAYIIDNVLKIESTEQLNGAKMTLTNMLGQKIKSEPITSDYSHDMNVSELTQGIYIVTIEKDGKMCQKKFMID